MLLLIVCSVYIYLSLEYQSTSCNDMHIRDKKPYITSNRQNRQLHNNVAIKKNMSHRSIRLAYID